MENKMKRYTMYFADDPMFYTIVNAPLSQILEFLWYDRSIAVGTIYSREVSELEIGQKADFNLGTDYPQFTILRVE
jgi:hypothetical protein